MIRGIFAFLISLDIIKNNVCLSITYQDQFMDFREDQDKRINNIQSRGFVIKDNLILMMYRIKDGEEYYVFPGGHMQVNETPEQTALREIEEETTVIAKDLQFAYEITGNLKGKTTHEYYFTGKWKSGEPTLSGEESRRSTSTNFYKPVWIELGKITDMHIYPDHCKEWVINNICSNAKLALPKISAPALRALSQQNIKSLTDIIKYSEREISLLHGVGPNTIIALKKKLNENGMTLKK